MKLIRWLLLALVLMMGSGVQRVSAQTATPTGLQCTDYDLGVEPNKVSVTMLPYYLIVDTSPQVSNVYFNNSIFGGQALEQVLGTWDSYFASPNIPITMDTFQRLDPGPSTFRVCIPSSTPTPTPSHQNSEVPLCPTTNQYVMAPGESRTVSILTGAIMHAGSLGGGLVDNESVNGTFPTWPDFATYHYSIGSITFTNGWNVDDTLIYCFDPIPTPTPSPPCTIFTSTIDPTWGNNIINIAETDVQPFRGGTVQVQGLVGSESVRVYDGPSGAGAWLSNNGSYQISLVLGPDFLISGPFHPFTAIFCMPASSGFTR